MRGCARVVAWVLTSLAAVWALITVLIVFFPSIDEETGEPTDAALGGVLLTAIFGIPGGIMMWRTGVASRDEKFENQLVGFVYSHDRFTVADLARKIGRSEMETEALVQELNVKRNIGLAFHRQTREYIHFGRVQQQHGLVSRCTACGANIGQQIVFPGEHVTCPYCNAAVQGQPHAPGQPAPGSGYPPGQGYDVPQPVGQHPQPHQNPYAAPHGQPSYPGQQQAHPGQTHPGQAHPGQAQQSQPQPPYPPQRPPGNY